MRQDVCDLLARARQLKFCVEIAQAALQVRHLFLFRRRLLRRPAQGPGLEVGDPRLQDPDPQPMEHGFLDPQPITSLFDGESAGDRLEDHLQAFLGPQGTR
jgi:hypothetical protein